MPNMNHPDFEYIQQSGAPNCWVQYERGAARTPDPVSDFMALLFTRLAKGRPTWEFIQKWPNRRYGVYQDGAELGTIWQDILYRQGLGYVPTYAYTNSRVDKSLKRKREKQTSNLNLAVKGILGTFYGETKEERINRIISQGHAGAAQIGSKIHGERNGAWYKIQDKVKEWLATNEIPGLDTEQFRKASEVVSQHDAMTKASKVAMFQQDNHWYASKAYTTSGPCDPSHFLPVVSMSDDVRMRLALLKTLDPDVPHPDIGTKIGEMFIVMAEPHEVTREEVKETEDETL